MADMMDAQTAKQFLGCDDATLQNFINNGTIRAQKLDGRLMLSAVDVQQVARAGGSDSDEGTIILSGDSEDLSIDLGEVVDDSATAIHHSDESADSITFGDDLEVVNFDDSHTEDLQFDEATATEDLSFTDSNTAVVTDVDETVIGTGTATATNDFQTVDYGDDTDGDRPASGSVRRSVRSQRVRQAAPKVHWMWPTSLILTALIVAFFTIPYPFMAVVPQDEDEVYANDDRKRGAIDSLWTDIAQGLAGFSPEPDPEAYRRTHPDNPQGWVAITNINDPLQSAAWRYKQYRGEKDSKARIQEFIIRDIQFDEGEGDPVPRAANSQTNDGNVLKTYTVTPKSDSPANADDEPVQRYVPQGKW